MTREQRKHELFRLPLSVLLKEYRRIKNIPDGPHDDTSGILVSELIYTILDAEFPEPKSREAK
jgi:hypothetical protein